MPTYEYRCDRGHTFEVVQSMSDDPVSGCQTCDASVQRVFHPVAVHFKGSGFYNTDYGKKKKDGASDSTGESSKDGDKGGDKGGDKSDSKPKSESSDAKPAKKDD